ncbi:MAG: FlgO family outer membrane protein [Acidobacteriota bacterium]
MFCYKCRANVSEDSLYCHNCGSNLLKGIGEDSENEVTRDLKVDDNSDLKVGEQFGDRYKIIEELGRGGMGRVYKAEDRVLGAIVALKIIRPEYLSDNRMIERFKKEILLAREITNENVVRIHDFGEEKGIKFITMNYIEGKSLKEIIIDEGPLKFERILSIAKDVSKGLKAAHKKGIIHRDLKPQNIMMGENDHIYITDFGLAKSIEGTSVSQTGLAIGTPQYIAPEQWKGEEADRRSDIYTFGIVLFEMVTGRSLFTSDTDLGYLQKHLNEKPVLPSELKDELPLYFRKVILKCLEKERELRYQSVEELLSDLEEGSFAATPFLKKVRNLKFRRIKLSPVTIAAFIFSVVLLLKLFVPGTSDIDLIKKRTVAILSFKNMSGLKILDHLSNSLSDLLITDLGQSKFIKVMPEAKLFKILNTTNYTKNNNLNTAIIEDIYKRGNVNYLIHGSFIQSGKKLRINVKLLDSETGELVDSSSADTETDNIFPAVDRLTRELKKSFKLTDNEIFEDIDTNIENITTSSQEALKCYIEGKRLFNLAKYKESLVPLRKAVKIDPEFAMGYRKIAWTYAYLYDWDKRKEYFEKTIEHVDKLSEKEKLKILGDYYTQNSNTFNKSIDSYKKLLKIYPKDTDTNYKLGLIYRILERYDEAVDRVKIVLEEDGTNINALICLLGSYGLQGKYDEIERKIKEFESIYSNLHKEIILRQRYRLYLIMGKFDLASMVIDELNSLKNDQNIKYSKWEIYFSNENYELVKREFSDLKNNELKNYKNINIEDEIYLSLIHGKLEDSVNILTNNIFDSNVYKTDKLWAFDELLNIYMRNGKWNMLAARLNKNDIRSLSKESYWINKWKIYKSMLLINSGKLSEAESIIKIIEKSKINIIFNSYFKRQIYYLKGKIEEKKGNIKDAVRYFKNIIDLLPEPFSRTYYSNFHTLYFFEIAQIYFKSGQNKKAEEWFSKLQSFKPANLYFGDLYARSYYYTGKIYQKKKWFGKAIESYKKFLSLWENGDSDIVKKYIHNTKTQLKIIDESSF